MTRHRRHQQEPSQARAILAQDSLSLPVTSDSDIEMNSLASPRMNQSYPNLPTPPGTPNTTSDEPDDDDATVDRIEKDLLAAELSSQKQAQDPSSPDGKIHFYEMDETDPKHSAEKKKKIKKAKKSKAFRDKVFNTQTKWFSWIRQLLKINRDLKNERKTTLNELQELKNQYNAKLSELNDLKNKYEELEESNRKLNKSFELFEDFNEEFDENEYVREVNDRMDIDDLEKVMFP